MSRETNGEIDQKAMSRLVDIFGAGSVAQLIDACLEDVEASLKIVRAGRANRAPEMVRRGAHRLAGVLAQYACPQAAERAGRVAHDDTPDARTQAADLIALAVRCQMELRIFRDGLPKPWRSHNPQSGRD